MTDEQPQPVAYELLPCPFCGSEASRQTTQRRHEFFDAVECTNELCGVFIVADEHDQNEIKKWNTRAHAPTSAASQPDAVRVTDEMVERAMQAYYRAYNDDGYTRKTAIRSAIEAVLNPPARSAARGDVPNATPKAEADPFADKYHELLMAVASKFPGESRHATALRYINERENLPTHGPAQNATPTSGGEK